MFTNQTFLITGIADENSLAMYVAKKNHQNNGNVVCTGLSVTPFHKIFQKKQKVFLINLTMILKMLVKNY